MPSNNQENRPYFVSRQRYFGVDQPLCVEIAYGGIDYANPDMLVPRFGNLGEGQAYYDPRLAVEAAIKIRDAWKTQTLEAIRIDYGATGGNTIPFTDNKTNAELRTWANARFIEADKCTQCGEVINGTPYVVFDNPDDHLCSDNCAEQSVYSEAEDLA